MKQLLTAEQVSESLDDLYRSIFAHWPNLKKNPPAIVGVRTRGEIIAERFLTRLAEDGIAADRGILDVTFYRDDLSQRAGAPLVRATEIGFDLENRTVVLVDDVLYTGRSVRAAMDALMDYGRPKAIRLAVLVDRGGRELPIAADYVGRRLDVPDKLRVQVELTESDGRDGVFLVPPKRRTAAGKSRKP
jgi:pyrimidine operon attenuation protein/uracil phosphoribosyltransferase